MPWQGSMSPSQLNDCFPELYEETGECLLWPVSRTNGYGQVWHRGRVVRAHRLAWEEANGPVPAGLVIKHRCDNRACCLLDHLAIGSHYGNMREAFERGGGKAAA